MRNNINGYDNSGLGANSLYSNTSGQRNTASGSYAMYGNTTGSFNASLGFNSLYSNLSGSENTAVGYEALYSNQASENTAVGSYALRNNTNGIQNVAVGTGSLISNTTSSGNTAIGYNALTSNTDGAQNTAVGSWAMNSTNTGFSNTAFGSYAMSANEGGIGNVAIGSEALFSNISGHSNVAIGFGALGSNQLSTGNVAMGFEALYQSLNDRNVAIGNQALRNNSGNNNTALGYNVGYDSTGSFNVFIGNEAGYNETGSNKLYIENSSATSTGALIYGEFDTNLLRFNADVEVNTGSLNVDSGTLFVDEVNNRVGVGTIAPTQRFSVNGAANLNQGIGTGVALQVNGSEALWYNGTYFSWGFGATANYFADHIGIGTSTPDTELHIEGGTDANLAGGGFMILGAVTGWNIVMDDNEILARNNGGTADLNLQINGGDVRVGGAVVHTSDKRLKKNIEPIGYGLKEVLQLAPKKYYWKNRPETPNKSFGLIAQEVNEIVPELVTISETKEKYLGVNYTELIPVLIKAIQEQDEKISKLQNQVEDLKLKKE